MAYVMPDIGYCQGMNFIASSLLRQLDDQEQAFWIMLSLIINKKMKKLLIPGVPSLHMRIYQMNQLVQKHCPQLYQHFNKNQIGIDYFATKWIMTLFTSFFSFQVLPPILDYFFLDGWKGIYKIAIAILKYLEFEFRNMDLLAFAKFFRESKSYTFNINSILEIASDVKITNRQLQKMKDLFYTREAQSKLNTSPDKKWPQSLVKTFNSLKDILAQIDEQAKQKKYKTMKNLSYYDEKLQKEQVLLRDANKNLSKINQEFKQILGEKQALELTSSTLKEDLIELKTKLKKNKKAPFWRVMFQKKKPFQQNQDTETNSNQKKDLVNQTVQNQQMFEQNKKTLKPKPQATELLNQTVLKQSKVAISPPSVPPPHLDIQTQRPVLQTQFDLNQDLNFKERVKQIQKQSKEIDKRFKKAVSKYQKLKKEYDKRLVDFNEKTLSYQQVRQKKEFFKNKLNKLIITLELKKQEVFKDLAEKIQYLEELKCTISF